MTGADPRPDDPGARIEELLQQQGLGTGSDGPGSHDAGEPTEPAEAADPLDALLAGGGAVAPGHDDGPESGDTPEDDAADELPDAPLFALLRTVEGEIGIDRIDRIWVFPPRRMEAGETSVVVVAAFPEIHPDRRRVYAAHYTAPADAAAPRLALDEYGTAPAERVGRLVEDVVERLKDQPAAPPASYRVEGNDARWLEALHELAEKHLHDAENNPRLRR